MKQTAISAICLLLLSGAGIAGPILAKVPPARPIVPPMVPTTSAWYAGVSSGYLWLNDATACGCQDLHYKDGWGINGSVGYRFSPSFLLGLAAGYLSGNYDVVDGHGGGATGSADLHMVPITLNATYTLNLTDSLLMYAGAGLGTAWSELQGVSAGEKDGDWHFAWQARAGLGYKVTSDVSLNLGYRYVQVLDAMSEYGDAKGHMAEAGFKVNF